MSHHVMLLPLVRGPHLENHHSIGQPLLICSAFPAPLWNLSREGCVRNNQRKGEMWRPSRFPLSLLLISESEPGLKCGILFCPLHNCRKNYVSKDATCKTPGEAPQLPAAKRVSVWVCTHSVCLSLGWLQRRSCPFSCTEYLPPAIAGILLTLASPREVPRISNI